ncbi:TPA: CRISPR-associated protein [Campylobacter lari]|nr:CRISPR-associated protein [Campylobacter lari]
MKYKITFLDFWHLSSGLSGGAKFDESVVKDSQGLPYVPGKTIKGLLRDLIKDEEVLRVCFGDEGEKIACCYFSNAFLEDEVRAFIANDPSMKFYLYDELANISIEKDSGVIKDGSLRELEVVKPLSLFGSIENIPPKYEASIANALKSIKRMGLNRNRGLGRCKIEVIGE